MGFQATLVEDGLRGQIEYMKTILDERQYRCYLGRTALALGRGGKAAVARLSGASVNTVRRGAAEAAGGPAAPAGRVRRPGGGRKPASVKAPGLREAIERVVDGDTYGDPCRVIHWTTRSLASIAATLGSDYGIRVSHTTVAGELSAMGYSKQLNRKMLQSGAAHPDRDAQFRYIAETSRAYIAAGDPVISVDCKKKENLGNFRNGGGEYRRRGDARKVMDHDFLVAELGRVAPYGVYDVDKNTGFVNLGTGRDTPEFAVNSVAQWWLHVGRETYPGAERLYITCDGGGSNGSRVRLWKAQLAEFAGRTGLEVHVSHLPPGTSKWNKVEHRLFCYISRSWAGQPLVDVETVVDLIGATTTRRGLTVRCVLDTREYHTGVKVPAEDYERINIERIEPMPGWNYIIRGFKTS